MLVGVLHGFGTVVALTAMLIWVSLVILLSLLMAVSMEVQKGWRTMLDARKFWNVKHD